MADHRKNPALQLQMALREIERLRQEIAQMESDIMIMKGWTLQQALDIAQIALNREFGFGPDRNARFSNVYMDTFLEYADLCIEDGEADEQIVYTKEKVDRALRQACGPDIKPFDERYATENLYYRDKVREREEKANG